MPGTEGAAQMMTFLFVMEYHMLYLFRDGIAWAMSEMEGVRGVDYGSFELSVAADTLEEAEVGAYEAALAYQGMNMATGRRYADLAGLDVTDRTHAICSASWVDNAGTRNTRI